VDGVPVPSGKSAQDRHPILTRVKPEQVAWANSRWYWGLILALAAFWATAVSLDPWAQLSGDAVVLLPTLPGFETALVLGAMMGVTYLHELGHYFVAKSYGIDATISMKIRFGLIILITDVTNAWLLPRKAQFRIFLAGIAVNVLLGGSAMLLAEMIRLHVIAGGAGLVPLLRFFSFVNAVPIFFQFFIIARTDFYYVLAAIFGERRLRDDSLAYLRLLSVHAWARVRGFPTLRCSECQKRVLPDDPYCLRCGVARTPQRPNRFPLRYERRYLHLAFGAFFVGALSLTYLVGLGILKRIKSVILASGVLSLRDGPAHGSLLHTVDAVLLAVLLMIQAAYLLWKVPRRIYRLGRWATRLVRSAARRPEAPREA
jgi:hypothetical protein